LFGHKHDVSKTQLAGAESKLNPLLFFLNIIHLFNYNSIALYLLQNLVQIYRGLFWVS